jgi:hypothetical protein
MQTSTLQKSEKKLSSHRSPTTMRADWAILLARRVAVIRAFAENQSTLFQSYVRATPGQMHEEGWEIEYAVIEELPPKEKSPHQGNPSKRRLEISAEIAPEDVLEPLDLDQRETTLKIITDSISIHIVRQVEFHTEEHDVQRHSWKSRSRLCRSAKQIDSGCALFSRRASNPIMLSG